MKQLINLLILLLLTPLIYSTLSIDGLQINQNGAVVNIDENTILGEILYDNDEINMPPINYTSNGVLIQLEDFTVSSATFNYSTKPNISSRTQENIIITSYHPNIIHDGYIETVVNGSYLYKVEYTSSGGFFKEFFTQSFPETSVLLSFFLPLIEFGNNIIFLDFRSEGFFNANIASVNIFSVIASFIGIYILISTTMMILRMAQGRKVDNHITIISTNIALGILAMIAWLIKDHMMQFF